MLFESCIKWSACLSYINFIVFYIHYYIYAHVPTEHEDNFSNFFLNQ